MSSYETSVVPLEDKKREVIEQTQSWVTKHEDLLQNISDLHQIKSLLSAAGRGHRRIASVPIYTWRKVKAAVAWLSGEDLRGAPNSIQRPHVWGGSLTVDASSLALQYPGDLSGSNLLMALGR
ncbi:hypothetical protein D4764_19G0004320 [Takifugu flavidus]|uniref:Uncharacterized protein n=1 Tax=Takifugu flavidus TaxID=433684 RepID=A0A5C6NML4_9TELE|nr:hypothetical protein D4764_19G0004320 [Takifugu flavidus]